MAERRKDRGGSAVFLAMLLAALLAAPGCKDKDAQGPVVKEGAVKAGEKAEAPRELAPLFSVKTFDGGVFSLEAARGVPVVINFWASWCGPCRLEAPEIERAYKAFKASGVEFIGVAVQDAPENAREFVRKNNLTFKTGLDDGGEIAVAYGLTGVPQTFVVDRQGRLSYVHIGVITADVLAEEIKKVL